MYEVFLKEDMGYSYSSSQDYEITPTVQWKLNSYNGGSEYYSGFVIDIPCTSVYWLARVIDITLLILTNCVENPEVAYSFKSSAANELLKMLDILANDTSTPVLYTFMLSDLIIISAYIKQHENTFTGSITLFTGQDMARTSEKFTSFIDVHVAALHEKRRDVSLTLH